MNKTTEFQKLVETHMNKYFEKKLKELKKNNFEYYEEAREEYWKEYENIMGINCFDSYFNEEKVLLSAISEAATKYTLNDFYNNNDNTSIYSPRTDIAFSPSFKKKGNFKNQSLGIYKLTENTQIFKIISKLDFVKKLAEEIKSQSNLNFASFGLCSLSNKIEDWENNLNKRPLHLIGIEIENSLSKKYLMGDLLNAISLAKFPIILVPQAKLNNLFDMLKYTNGISDLKGLNIYNILGTVNILSISQFRELLNKLLLEENLKPIPNNFL